jgi:hypothetical protein
MPEGIEYLHCVQLALDANGLSYQVLDIDGFVREQLAWPVEGVTSQSMVILPGGAFRAPVSFPDDRASLCLRFMGRAAIASQGAAQTLFSTHRTGELPPFWFGLRGTEQRLTAIVHHEPGRSPHYWLGPSIKPGNDFHIEIMLNANMGPGGIMYRAVGDQGWTSMSAASPWGLERLKVSQEWRIGHSSGGVADRPFMGSLLVVSLAS